MGTLRRLSSPRLWLGLAGPLLVLAVWGNASAAGWVPRYLLPAPQEVVWAAVGFVTGKVWSSPHAGSFWGHSMASLGRVLTGFSIAAVAGVVLGALCGRWQRLAWFVDPTVQLVRAVPGISWLPLALVWFGIGTPTAVFLIGLAAFFPVYLNALHGVRSVPEIWVRAAQTLGARRRHLFWLVILPGAMPSIETGLRVAMGLSWAYVVLGELTGVNRGLGAMIMDARMLGDVTTVLVGMVSIALLGFLSDQVLLGILRHVPGHRSRC